MNTPKKYRIIKFVVVMLIMLPIAYFSYYQFIYTPLFSFKKFWFTPPKGVDGFFIDGYRNAEFLDSRNNMLLIITLPNTGQGDSAWWQVMPRSKSYAEFYSNYGHVVGVRLRKNSFVVVDGVTGEELVVQPITKEEREQWRKDAPYFERLRCDGERYDNLLEGSFDFFSLPKEKFLEIQEKVNQHDTSNERERGSGFFIQDDGTVRVL